MAHLSAHKFRLEQLDAALHRQMQAVNSSAARLGVAPEEVHDHNGSLVLAPLLIARANIEVALLQIELAT